MANLRPKGGWTEEQENELRELVKIPNITNQEIADRVSRVTTKNSVISKLSSMGIKLPNDRAKRLKTAAKSHATQKAKPKDSSGGFLRLLPKHEPVIPLEPPSAEGITMDELKSTSCRWPLGYPVKYCGKYRSDGEAYCPTHKALAEGREVDLSYKARPVYGRTWKR